MWSTANTSVAVALMKLMFRMCLRYYRQPRNMRKRKLRVAVIVVCGSTTLVNDVVCRLACNASSEDSASTILVGAGVTIDVLSSAFEL